MRENENENYIHLRDADTKPSITVYIYVPISRDYGRVSCLRDFEATLLRLLRKICPQKLLPASLSDTSLQTDNSNPHQNIALNGSRLLFRWIYGGGNATTKPQRNRVLL